MSRWIYWLRGWLFVRPIRWLFWKMIAQGSFGLRLWWRREWEWVYWPNPHWWALYHTVFRFCKWLHYDAWRPFCDWTGGWRQTFPWPARFIQGVGSLTAGYVISGGQCFHCASPDGCQVMLAADDPDDDGNGPYFRLLKTWSTSTMDGTDHRFYGITTCPKCGYEAEYEDGSL